MTLLKAGALALMIPVAFAAPTFAQDEGRDGPPRMIFSELDADGSGAVTLEELRAAGANRFANADADGDGALSRDELLAQGQERIEARVDRLLERADADGDGQLTQAEMEEAREGRRGFGRRGPNPERIFERMDADSDGSVTQAEFDEAVATFLERMGRRHGDRR
ncbi:EF-hand domain-containing protein [Jannaschia sp. CCS1]|uniref:EF-hand domain-containing protein n=1 Tax=Jannaschia sp. (strain CCS1) TaxID=290400 RepID=UPI000053CA77|nr:EF-hand domain-containing protein [Jannaschia sp. CCS1]ABD56052.1 Calcium-binding EF-hand [Jannaschia sp. CCS1]